MKKKFLTILLTLAAVLCLCFGLVACDNGSGNSATDSGSTTEQGENGSTKPDEGGSTRPDEGGTGGSTKPDEGGTGGTTKPDEGGGTKPEEHVHSFTDYVYNNDATCTEDGTETATCTCGVSDTRPSAGTATGHSYTAENLCSGCGDQWKFTEGLTYELDPDTNTYTVTGRGTVTNKNIVIPYGYRGKYVTKIGDEALSSQDFSQRDWIESVVIPDSVTSIGKKAFQYCNWLTRITIPDSVTSIGDYAFYVCSELRNVTIPDGVTSIGEGTFDYCSGLTSITIPDGVTSIGSSAFRYCEKLTNITIPNSVTYIGANAFYYCKGLISIDIPDSVTEIGGYAFSDTAYYKDQSHWDESGVLYIGNHLIEAKSSISGAYTVRTGIKTIAGSAFSGCSSLTSIEIPDSVTSIGVSAFKDCSGLTDIVIPDSVTSIGGSAFGHCSGLTSITIPDSVVSIGDMAFSNCYNLVEVWNYSELDITAGASSNGDVAYYAKKVYTTNEASKQTLTDDGYLFYEDESGSFLIAYRGDQTDLTLPAKSPMEKDYQINQGVFYNCKSLTSIEIPDGVTSIGSDAFRGCSGLKSVTIGSGVTAIGNNAFNGCSKLTSITIPKGVTEIGGYTFYDCSSLTSIEIPDGVTLIGDSAFYRCSNLIRITIPKSVTKIDMMAFAYCSSLRYIYFEGTMTQWNSIRMGSGWDSETGDYTLTTGWTGSSSGQTGYSWELEKKNFTKNARKIKI